MEHVMFEFWRHSTMVGENFEYCTSQMPRNASKLSNYSPLSNCRVGSNKEGGSEVGWIIKIHFCTALYLSTTILARKVMIYTKMVFVWIRN